jgi:hypothetical protein
MGATDGCHAQAVKGSFIEVGIYWLRAARFCGGFNALASAEIFDPVFDSGHSQI